MNTFIDFSMRAAMMLLIAVFTTAEAWADGTSSFGGGDGSAKNPYLIKTTAQWDQFASDVNSGTTYSDKYFQLDADITVTTMVGAGTTGNNAKPFSGTFDGGGHKLTFNHTATEAEGDIAPFRFVKNAFICNLHVAGEINTAYRHAGGLAGRTYGNTLIRNCRVSTVIKSSVSGDGTHGGIVALKPDWSTAHLTIEGCVYDGKILSTGTTATTHCGGFVGYTSYGSLTIMNSIYAPAAAASGESAVSSEKTFYRFNAKHKGDITLYRCYYTQTIGNDDTQGKQTLSIGFPEGVDITVVPTGDATEYDVSGITGYDDNYCVKYNGTVYSGYKDVVKLKFSHNFVGCTIHYNVGGNDLSGNDTNGYTLEMPDEDVIFGFAMIPPSLPGFEGDGTAERPYEIYHGEIWNYIAGAISRNESNYATAYYKLTDDITVTTMMGSENHRFKGHFDGNKHTLSVNYDTDEQYTAPFRYVEGAEISNLRVAGTIKTSAKFAAGFVANAKGNNSMTNCRSSVTINSSVNGDGTHGGFVAYNLSGKFTMTGCAFDGQMLGSNTNNCGGFVGWNETNGSPEGIVYFQNCLFAPTSITVKLEHTYARSRINDGARVQMYYSNCRTSIGDNQQFRVYSINAGDDVTVATTQTPVNTYDVSGITIYKTGMMYDNVLYARENQDMSLTLSYTGAGSLSGFTTSSGTLSGTENPHTLSMGKGDAIINAIISDGTGWTHGGSGTSESPYIISSSDEWNEFANNVNSSVYGFNTAYYKLTANITVTTMAGTENHKFKGHFDGNGKTLTLNYGTEGSIVNEDYCAPFRYIEGADIHNLTVDGTIRTNKQFAAGIAGYALNNNTITDCRSSVTIDSNVSGDGTHGGFVANCQNNTDDESYVTFTRCAFDGKLLGTTTDNCGGFVGWAEGSDWAGVRFIDCIFKPSAVNIQTDGSATFSRGQNSNSERIIVEHSYYIQALGTKQGEIGYTAPPADFVTEPLTIAGVTIYVRKNVVTNLAASSITPTTATISWTGTDACSNYQVRYRNKDDKYAYYTSFEGGLPTGWTTFDNDDDDNYNWTFYNGPDGTMPHSGSGCMYSASYIKNVGVLEPDNWLVSPGVTLGGTLKVWLKGQDEYEYREHFAIYLSTTGGSKSNFLDANGNLLSTVVTLVPETETTDEYQEYTADLSAYSGQGYIAIRHFNCEDEFYLVLDDFSVSKANVGDLWTAKSGASPTGTTLTGLTPNTTYEYQIGYDYGGHTYYTSSAELTTLAADIAPDNLSATGITANAATISWTGYGESYNLRYSQGGIAKVTLSVPNKVWDDGSGYQMLLDKDHNTYGRVIPESGGLTTYGNASADTYAEFECKIPTTADGDLETENIVDGSDNNKSVTITIPAGTYDWCITNPSPDDRVWIASGNGNVGGRQDDFTFDSGKHYTFTVTMDGSDLNDCVNMTVEDDETISEQGSVTTVKDITTTFYNLSGLSASTGYTIYVQSVRGGITSEWSGVSFKTLNAEELYLYDDQDNSTIIANAAAQVGTVDVTLQGRTLYRDGKWNTITLPFNLSAEQIASSVLASADIRALSSAEFSNSTLTLNFTDENAVTTLTAGTPYIVKWAYSETNIENPTFTGVTISNANNDKVCSLGEGKSVTFKGTYKKQSYTAETPSILLLGDANTLYYPLAGASIGAQRAYFLLDGLTASEKTNQIRAFVLNFSDETTSIRSIENGKWKIENEAGAWYGLDGRKLDVKPTRKGLYIHNGVKVVIK